MKFVGTQEPVGRWVMPGGNCYFYVLRRPGAWHRFWMKRLLGFTWEDTP